MYRKCFSLALLTLCTLGLSMGCSGGPDDIVLDKDAKPTLGAGQGEVEGKEAPKGTVAADPD